MALDSGPGGVILIRFCALGDGPVNGHLGRL